MLCRLSRCLNARRPAFAVITALAGIVLLAAPSALAATPLTGETLAGAGTTTSGQGSGNCIYRGLVFASANFNASGPATGPYRGQFVAINGGASLSGYRNPPWRLRVLFTITSGNTTITGAISNPYPYGWGIGPNCNGSAIVGFGANATNSAYTATINVLGQAPQTVNGQVHFTGNFSTQPGAQTSISATFN